MNIIICGAGEVGRHAAEVLGASGNNVTIIDRQPAKLAAIEQALDVRTLVGNGTHADVLHEAGCANAGLFMAATSSDEINLLSASIASAAGADRTVARVHHSAYYAQHGLDYAQHLGVDHLVCPENTTALAIAQTLRNPGALAVERFARGRIEMQQLPVTDGAAGLGAPLAQLKLPGSVRVVAIEHDGRTTIPDGSAVVASGDVITIVADVDTFDRGRKMFHTEQARRKRVMIMGGTPMGVWLCRALRSRRFSVRLFETDTDRCLELSEKLPWITVLSEDPTDPTVLEQQRVEQLDAFVALTGDDEHNILTAARAKSLGAQQAVAVLQRPTYLHLLEHVGIDKAFSPRDTAINEVVNLLDTAPVRRLATVAEGVADVYEVRVSPKAAEIVGRSLRDMRLDQRIIIAAIQRDGQVFVPGGKDVIHGGDTVVLIGPSGMERQLRKIFAAG